MTKGECDELYVWVGGGFFHGFSDTNYVRSWFVKTCATCGVTFAWKQP